MCSQEFGFCLILNWIVTNRKDMPRNFTFVQRRFCLTVWWERVHWSNQWLHSGCTGRSARIYNVIFWVSGKFLLLHHFIFGTHPLETRKVNNGIFFRRRILSCFGVTHTAVFFVIVVVIIESTRLLRPLYSSMDGRAASTLAQRPC